MADCKRCHGMGTVIDATCCCHPNSPACSHVGVRVPCDDCDGMGRFCNECSEPIGLDDSPGVYVCRDCRYADLPDDEPTVTP